MESKMVPLVSQDLDNGCYEGNATRVWDESRDCDVRSPQKVSQKRQYETTYIYVHIMF